MKLYVPDYYFDFKCIAEKCRHSCCIGWEIDIDPDTLNIYDTVGGDIGDRIRESIEHGDTPHFKLKADGRCPFLNDTGLCDIISELGNGALCDICADHPRYRNYFKNRLEMGLGLTCEEAARLILTKEDKVRLINTETKKSARVFPERQKIIDLLQDRRLPFSERLDKLISFEKRDYSPLLYSLERLDKAWEEYIKLLKTDTDIEGLGLDTAFEQLAVCFLLRHSADSLEAAVKFSAFSTYIVMKLSAGLREKRGTLTLHNLCEISRIYSSEIEYSDENIKKILERI